MHIKGTIKRIISFLLHGERSPIYAQISYLEPNNRLKGKKIIVTGANRGLGYSMAKKFTEEGADVLITGRNEESLKKAAEQIGCHYIVLDVIHIKSIKPFFEKAYQLLGDITCLVCNAGISLHEKDFFQITEDSFNCQIDTNLKANVFLAQEFVRLHLSQEKAGNILFISSEVGELADNRPYGWTKGALNSFVKGIASNFIEKGIRINAISPGVTCSNMTGLNPNEDLFVQTNKTKRAYLPEEVAEIATFMLSDCSNCLSGQIIVCNNGKTINTRF